MTPSCLPEIAEGMGVKLVDFDTLLAESDVISIHMNLTDQNYHIFNKEAFSKMKSAPSSSTRAAALSSATRISSGRSITTWCAARRSTMLESENPDLSDCSLLGRENVLLTPHSGYYSETSDYLVAKYSMDNALAYFNREYDKVKVMRNSVRN